MSPLRANPYIAALGLQSSIWNFTLGTSTTQILGPNTSRIALSFLCPVATSSAASPAVTPSSGTSYLSWTNPVVNTDLHTYTCPANTVAYVSNAKWELTSGSQPTLILFAVRSGTTYQMTGTVNPDTQIATQLFLAAGDAIKFFVSSGTTCTGISWFSVENWTAGATGAPSPVTQMVNWSNPANNTVVASYTVPAGTSAHCTMMDWSLTSGLNPTIVAAVERSGTRFILTGSLGSRFVFNPDLWLTAGDVIEHFATVGQTVSAQSIISMESYPISAGGGGGGAAQAAFVGFKSGIANGGSIGIFPNTIPVELSYELLGASIFGPVWAYGSVASTPLTVIETFLTPGINPATAIQLASAP